MIAELNKLVQELTAELPIAKKDLKNKDICELLYHLLITQEWHDKEIESLDFISKKIDITKKLYRKYSNKGKKISNEQLDSKWLDVVIYVLSKGIEHDSNNTSLCLKRFNVLFKALDIHTPSWSKLLDKVNDEWQKLILTLPQNQHVKPTAPLKAKQCLKTIPLTVLFYEGPIARAYMATLRHLGLKPQKIIHLIAENDLLTKKPVGKWLPKGMRKNYAANVQKNKIHYWAKHLAKTNNKLVNEALKSVQNDYNFCQQEINDANKLLPLEQYGENIDSLFIKNLSDASLLEYLQNEPKSALLYTGGGIVPAKLLSLTHLKFIHIHPGFLPEIRGADCTLWSSLITNHASASCFYMSPGIDEGDIILPCWLPKLTLNTEDKTLDNLLYYRLVYGYIDPWVRSYVLKLLLINNDRFENLESYPQNPQAGLTYHFMHNKLKQIAIKNLFAQPL
jgi:hypothetical protein